MDGMGSGGVGLCELKDKIRCDGSRPCTSCTKKGYAANQCIDGCEPCRRARTRCEGGKPCLRCRDHGLACQDDGTLGGAQGPSASGSGAQGQELGQGMMGGAMMGDGGSTMPVRNVRSGGERAKLACTNCRRDNKKCDDQRPCPRCVARGEECVHVGRGPKLVKLRCEACRKDNKRCEEVKPCGYCVEQKVECVTQPRKGRGHGTRVKAACMSCRRDKIRCDGVRPCSSCVRKNFECVDRACKSCAQDGRATECTHRKAPEASRTDQGQAMVIYSPIGHLHDMI
ncbi:hypothetical protein BDN72DRAFT_285337 [Pluteus cervinus]|uniref:Uncharacterized protein n=1 Tax=Pluteus cervinus TaxID=181527 RepID=A0ACD3ADW2_9AGAR|nr:hypothetical protein BDN72DRAFT_285337 [Pluteus cervinus]